MKAAHHIQIPSDIICSKVPVACQSEAIVSFFNTERPGESVVTINKDDLKPKLISTAIEQICNFGHLGKEIDGWVVSYYAPAFPEKDGTFTPSQIIIPPAPMGVIGRYIIPSHDEVAHLTMRKGSISATKKVLFTSGYAYNISFSCAYVTEITFRNVKTERVVKIPRGGKEHSVSKNPTKRIVLVIDSYPNSEVMAKEICETVENKTGLDLKSVIPKELFETSSTTSSSSSPDTIPYPET